MIIFKNRMIEKERVVMDSKDIIQNIKEICLHSSESNPILLIRQIMKEDYIPMHGPIHHILDGACLLTALYNQNASFSLDKAIDEMIERGSKMPGATCGQWGMCGSASSIGAALSIIHQSTPLSNDQLYRDNIKYVSLALNKIADIGGPRCCKRNAFLSLYAAIEFVNETYQFNLPSNELHCDFYLQNLQCIKDRCPFYPAAKKCD